jgi:hypothetical protein
VPDYPDATLSTTPNVIVIASEHLMIIPVKFLPKPLGDAHKKWNSTGRNYPFGNIATCHKLFARSFSETDLADIHNKWQFEMDWRSLEYPDYPIKCGTIILIV